MYACMYACTHVFYMYMYLSVFKKQIQSWIDLLALWTHFFHRIAYHLGFLSPFSVVPIQTPLLLPSHVLTCKFCNPSLSYQHLFLTTYADALSDFIQSHCFQYHVQPDNSHIDTCSSYVSPELQVCMSNDSLTDVSMWTSKWHP